MPFLSPGDLPDLAIEPGSPSLQEDSLPAELAGKPGSGGKFVGLQKIVPDTLYRVLSVNVQKFSNTVWKVIEDSTLVVIIQMKGLVGWTTRKKWGYELLLRPLVEGPRHVLDSVPC